MSVQHQETAVEAIGAMAAFYSLHELDFTVVRTHSDHDVRGARQTGRVGYTAIYAGPEGIDRWDWHQLKPNFLLLPYPNRTRVKVGGLSRYTTDVSLDVFKALAEANQAVASPLPEPTYLTAEASRGRHYGVSNEQLPVGVVVKDEDELVQRKWVYRRAQGEAHFRPAIYIGSENA